VLRYLLRLYSESWAGGVAGVGEEVIRRLQIHDFPGNVRELEGLVTGPCARCRLRPWRSLEPVALPERCSG